MASARPTLSYESLHAAVWRPCCVGHTLAVAPCEPALVSGKRLCACRYNPLQVPGSIAKFDQILIVGSPWCQQSSCQRIRPISGPQFAANCSSCTARIYPVFGTPLCAPSLPFSGKSVWRPMIPIERSSRFAPTLSEIRPRGGAVGADLRWTATGTTCSLPGAPASTPPTITSMRRLRMSQNHRCHQESKLIVRVMVGFLRLVLLNP